jgi:hypothetical protein
VKNAVLPTKQFVVHQGRATNLQMLVSDGSSVHLSTEGFATV